MYVHIVKLDNLAILDGKMIALKLVLCLKIYTEM